METLRQVVEQIDGLADHLVVYVPTGEALSGETQVVVQDWAGPGSAPAGMRSMLTMEDIKQVLDAWRSYHPGREPSTAEKVAAGAYYDENDAFIE